MRRPALPDLAGPAAAAGLCLDADAARALALLGTAVVGETARLRRHDERVALIVTAVTVGIHGPPVLTVDDLHGTRLTDVAVHEVAPDTFDAAPDDRRFGWHRIPPEPLREGGA